MVDIDCTGHYGKGACRNTPLMLQRAVAVAQIRGVFDCRVDVGQRVFGGSCQIKGEVPKSTARILRGELSGNCRGQRTAGSMGVAGFEAFVLEHFKARLQRQQISNDISRTMPAFDERGVGTGVH